MMTRRYDIDWLRVMAIGLLIVYHTAIGFQPWGPMIGFITNKESWMALWYPMSAINIWRIPLLFFVSGVGVALAAKNRTIGQLIGERAKRILGPYIFGFVCIVPLHVFILQQHYGHTLRYVPNPGHLWFLANIFVYALMALPVIYLLQFPKARRVHVGIRRVFSHPLGLVLMAGVLVAEVAVVQPALYEMYAFTSHGFLLGLLVFFVGFLCMYADAGFWQNVDRWKWLLLVVAVALFAWRTAQYPARPVPYLLPVESVAWILAVLGLAYRYLNKPSRLLAYLSQAAYPVYILHMVVLYLLSWLLFPLAIAVEWKYALVTLFTFGGCMLLYEGVRRVRLLRPLFGMRTK